MSVDPQTLTDDIYSKVQTLQDKVQTSMDRMASIATLPYLSWFNFAATPVYEPNRAKTITFGDLPTLQKALLNVDPAANNLEKYKAHTWVSSDLDTLQTKLMQYVNTGGVGIEQAVQDAIFNQGRERDLQTARDAMDLAGARTGARGCRYPTSMTKALQKEILTNYQNTKTDLNREIVKLMADLAQKNVQFAIQHDIAIEELHSSFAIKYSALYLDNVKYTIEKFKAEQDSYIAEFDGKLRGMLANLDLQKVNGNLELAYQQNLQEKWRIDANVLLEKGKAQIQQAEQANNIKIRAAAESSNAARSMMQAMTTNAITMVQKKG